MNKMKRYLIISALVIVVLLVVVNWTPPVQANKALLTTPLSTGIPLDRSAISGENVSSNQQEEIKRVIQEYFEIHYQALSISPPENFQETGFGILVSDGPDAKDFLMTEMAKLELERKHYELKGLRYEKYDFSLNYKAINIDESALTATVSLGDIFEFITESAAEANPKDPLVSSGGLSHEIILRNEGGQWKIVSDIYRDALWRTLRQPESTTDDVLRNIDLSMENMNDPPIQPIVKVATTDFSCGLWVDDSSHAYDRINAVDYAQTHVRKDSGEYNKYYPHYDVEGEDWGDCTNYVSQAIYEGGNSSMSIQDPLPTRSPDGQFEWYLLNGMQRASSWNEVGGSVDEYGTPIPGFYDFVTLPAAWNEGPEGCEMTFETAAELAERLAQIEIGDVIQYEMNSHLPDGDDAWDHSVIVVGRDINGVVQIASHSPDLNNVSYAHFEFGEIENIRLVHIERSDGRPPIKNFILVESDDDQTLDCDGYYIGNEVYLGMCENGHSIVSGFRFDDVVIPQGASIKYAYITFSVDGPYSNEIKLLIYGDDSGDSLPLPDYYLPGRDTTEAFVDWIINETWELTDNHANQANKYSFTSPQLAPIIEEIILRGDWLPGNAITFLIKNNDATGSNSWRRVIAKERATDSPDLFPARLIVAYESEEPTPTPTAIATNTPTPSPTATYTPTPTLTPTFTPTFTPSPSPTPSTGWAAAELALMKDEPVEKNMAYSSMLSQFRDQVMSTSSKGNDYIDSIYQHAPEIMLLFMQNEAIRLEAKALALDVQPLLESMLDDLSISSPPRLDKDWVEKTIDLLTKVENQVSPELWEEIQWWKDKMPSYVGKTGDEIWKMLPDRGLELNH